MTYSTKTGTHGCRFFICLSFTAPFVWEYKSKLLFLKHQKKTQGSSRGAI